VAARNANEAVVGSGGSLESGGQFLCWCVWQESGFGRIEDVFTFYLLKKAFYKCCTSSAIC
jgi:hypothetical protein